MYEPRLSFHSPPRRRRRFPRHQAAHPAGAHQPHRPEMAAFCRRRHAGGGGSGLRAGQAAWRRLLGVGLGRGGPSLAEARPGAGYHRAPANGEPRHPLPDLPFDDWPDVREVRL